MSGVWHATPGLRWNNGVLEQLWVSSSNSAKKAWRPIKIVDDLEKTSDDSPYRDFE